MQWTYSSTLPEHPNNTVRFLELITPVTSQTTKTDFVIPAKDPRSHILHLAIKKVAHYCGSHLGLIHIVHDIHPGLKLDDLPHLKRYKRIIRLIHSSQYVSRRTFESAYARNCSLPTCRQNWYWQQFLKLLSFRIPDISSHIVIWDADTVLCSRIDFFLNQLPIVMRSNAEYHIPYYQTFNKLMGTNVYPPFSFVSQYSPCFKSELVDIYNFINLRARKEPSLESFTDEHLFMCFILSSLVAPQNGSSFSEYETISLFRIITLRPFLITTKRNFRHGSYLPLPFWVLSPILQSLGYSSITFENQ